jgi:PLP dependent protein
MNTSVADFQAQHGTRAAVLAQRAQTVGAALAQACADAGRSVQEVTLLAVSKTFPASDVRALHACGQHRFGENYVQEASAKIAALADLRGAIEWHLIGPLQSNKTQEVAERFDWVHTVDRLKIAKRLSAQRPGHLTALNVLVQVNIDAAPTKAGVAADDARALVQAVQKLPGLRVRGLMVMPDVADAAATATAFAAARRLFHSIHTALDQPTEWDTLSMGMSADMGAAIAQGSTLVRVGSALFGAR